MDIIQKSTKILLKKSIPDFSVGDKVSVALRIAEAGRFRVQKFEGIVLSLKMRGIDSSFLVRKVSFGEGVEKQFLLHSPRLESVTVISRGKTRRAKLYYLRDRLGKSFRVKTIFAKKKQKQN